MSEQREFTGAFIPAKIWLDTKLSPAEKMLLGEVKALSEKTGWCYANNRHFSEWLHCEPNNVSMYISKMRKAGYLEVKYKNEKTFEGRKMRVDSHWYHGCQEQEAPFNGIEAPFNGIEAPFNGIEAEIEFKSTFNPVVNNSANQFENWLHSIKTDPSTKEAFTLSRKLPSGKFDEYFEAFTYEAKTKKETYHTRERLVSHFLNFSCSRYFNRPTQKFTGGPARPADQPVRYSLPPSPNPAELVEPKYRKL